MGHRALIGGLVAGALLALAAAPSDAQAPDKTPGVSSAFTRIRGVDAVISRPTTPNAHSGTAIVIMHDESDSLQNLQAPRLAAAGYVVLSTNARTGPDPEDHDTNWDNVLADLRTVVTYAKAMPGIGKVVLMGHSSGAPLMAAYQNIAENGVKAACQGPEKIVKCPDSLQGSPKADGVVLLDPIFGVGAVFLGSVDPSVTDEANPKKRDPALDSFSPANGFSAKGAHYPADFRKRYFAAEAARNNRLIDAALARLKAIQAGKGQFADDEPFLVAGATRIPRLWRPDLSMLAHTKRAHLLIKGDGTTTTEVIRSVRVPSGTEPSSQLFDGGALPTSVKRFLATFAVRATPAFNVTEDSIEGVDWASGYSNTPNNVEGVTAPILIMGMTGHYWLVSAEMAYDHARSADKEVAFVEGAVHGFTPCDACAKTPGQYGDTVAHTFDYVIAWLNKRF
ncbi:MAG TPA: alpha/beta fold hydrolase [Caulobacteraceae bacterium]|jgi:pimeloyl-ACP methyl ester carboxylesterase